MKIVIFLLFLLILTACSPLFLGELDQPGEQVSLSDTVGNTPNKYTFGYCCSPKSGLIVSHTGVDLAMTVIRPSGALVVTTNVYGQPGPLPEGTWTVVIDNFGEKAEDYILRVTLE